jgi:hypothetical protein
MSGRDTIGIAQTGTGKTAAFALPILHRLADSPRSPVRKSCRVLVLSPTRELVGQILDSFHTYGHHLRVRSRAGDRLRIDGRPSSRATQRRGRCCRHARPAARSRQKQCAPISTSLQAAKRSASAFNNTDRGGSVDYLCLRGLSWPHRVRAYSLSSAMALAAFLK